MGSKVTQEICVAAVFIVIYSWSGALAQSGCTTELTSLYPCLNYVSGNSSKPSSSCCSQLAGVVRSQPRCLCLLLNGGASSVGINVNQTLALALPNECNVQTPPSSKCNGNAPTSSTSTPAASAKQTPDLAKTPSVTDTTAGSKTVPSTDGSSFAGRNVRVSFQLVGFLLFVASVVLSGAGI